MQYSPGCVSRLDSIVRDSAQSPGPAVANIIHLSLSAVNESVHGAERYPRPMIFSEGVAPGNSALLELRVVRGPCLVDGRMGDGRVHMYVHTVFKF